MTNNRAINVKKEQQNNTTTTDNNNTINNRKANLKQTEAQTKQQSQDQTKKTGENADTHEHKTIAKQQQRTKHTNKSKHYTTRTNSI